MAEPAASPGAENPLTAEAERRLSPRFATTLRIPCFPAEADGAYGACQVRDVSTLGIALCLPQPVEIGDLLRLELHKREHLLTGSVLARVVHVDAAEGAWLVGCAFVTELQERELHLFEAAALRPSGREGRRWTRFPCSVETVCWSADTAPGEHRHARIVNISAGGIGFLLRCYFPPGTLLHFEFPSFLNPRPRTLLVRVLRTIEHDEACWFLACEFADRLSAQDVCALVSQPTTTKVGA